MLLDIGYYRLGFYWKFFEKDSQHNFRDGTCFSNVVRLYYLDVDLRNLLLRYIHRIEVNFRTQLIYTVSNKYPQSPTWFVDPTCMNKKYIEEIDSIYNDKFKRGNPAIKKHHKKYINDKYAPAWKTLEFFSFGAVRTTFLNLKDVSIKEKIAKSYGLKKFKILENFLEALVYVRNRCSHRGVLYDISTYNGVYNVPGYSDTYGSHSLKRVLNVMYFFLDTISKNRKEELRAEIEKIFQSLHDNQMLNQMVEIKAGILSSN